MSASKSFFDAVKERRTYYQLNKEAPISDKQITDIAEKAILHVPSSFNSQSTRLVVLLNKDHDTFWDYVLEVLKPMVPEDQFSGTQQKISGFKAAYGTVSTPDLFFWHALAIVEFVRASVPMLWWGAKLEATPPRVHNTCPTSLLFTPLPNPN
jgi:predicted oxidoreductase (fatty acid repression mutant protein)